MRAAAILGLCLVLAGCTSSVGPVASGTRTGGDPFPSPSTGLVSGPRISPPPVSPPTPPGTNLPAFACADGAGGAAGIANVTDVRVTPYSGFDRFVLQFDSSVPAYTVKRQPTPVFKAGASGESFTLSGTAGALVQVHSAFESSTYAGPIDFTNAGYLVVNEARLMQDFEGYVSWGLGLSHAACLRTFTLSDPPRLVVDFTSAAS
jgi:hypothetical protein